MVTRSWMGAVVAIIVGWSSAASADVCGSGLSTGNDAVDTCITTNCCASFTPCHADTACDACLMTPTGPGCDTNVLYQAYLTCADADCPTDFCDSGIGFNDETSGDPLFACNACASANCCACADGCVIGGSQTEVELCLACLDDPDGAACSNASVEHYARSLSACVNAMCAGVCDVLDGAAMGDPQCGPPGTGGDGGNGGTGGAAGAGGSTGSSGNGNSTGGDEDDDGRRHRRNSGDCDCSHAGTPASDASLLAILGVGLILARRRQTAQVDTDRRSRG